MSRNTKGAQEAGGAISDASSFTLANTVVLFPVLSCFTHVHINIKHTIVPGADRGGRGTQKGRQLVSADYEKHYMERQETERRLLYRLE